eukprot:Sspe_Gene.90267::Locus_61852_Transcript_1_1_Confidence_1.000_Length_536::g.90267::m.90267
MPGGLRDLSPPRHEEVGASAANVLERCTRHAAALMGIMKEGVEDAGVRKGACQEGIASEVPDACTPLILRIRELQKEKMELMRLQAEEKEVQEEEEDELR